MAENKYFLHINALNVHYGGIQALHGVSLHVESGEIVAVIGANGAGKSTLMKTVAGVKKATSGTVTLEGVLLPKAAHNVVKKGVTLVPEGRKIFSSLTVRENLLLGAYSRSNRHEVLETMENVFTLFPVLKERVQQVGGTLSGGEQQMLAVGRALMSRPRLLLLDEPSLGLAPIIIEKLFETIIDLNHRTGLTILLVEQNAALALEICQRAYVLKTGAIEIEGSGSELLEDPRVRESYLGVAS